MTKKEHPTALLRVEWPAGKQLRIIEITAMDEDGRRVTLKVLSIMPERSRRISQDPEAWKEGFDAGCRGLPRKTNPYPPGDSAFAWISGYLEGKAKPLRSVKDEQ